MPDEALFIMVQPGEWKYVKFNLALVPNSSNQWSPLKFRVKDHQTSVYFSLVFEESQICIPNQQFNYYTLSKEESDFAIEGFLEDA